MPRPRRSTPAPSARGGWRDRHGRGIRAAVTGPHLPLLRTRVDVFDSVVAATADYLRELWPVELQRTRFEVAGLPMSNSNSDGLDRWAVDSVGDRVVLYRVPIERLAHLHRDDEHHRRMLIESCVFRAVGELLGKDPWELAPDRFRHL